MRKWPDKTVSNLKMRYVAHYSNYRSDGIMCLKI